MYIENPKTKGSGILCAIPQKGVCPVGCSDCFFQSGRSYLEPLSDNLPNMPKIEDSRGRIIRVNDGNDSNHNWEDVIWDTRHYDDAFFNTSMPYNLEKFPRPIVLTINPHKMTDLSFHVLDTIPANLMFVRFRVNLWNLDLLDKAVKYYTIENNIPVVLTFMAYYNESIPEKYKDDYIWQKRILNSYYVLSYEKMQAIIMMYSGNKVYACGKACKDCGHCLREYYNTKERLRNGN